MNKKFYYGWIIAAAAASQVFLAGSPTCYGGSVITAKVAAQYGWGEEMVGASMSALFTAMALGGIPISVLIRRIGFRKGIIAEAALGLVSYLYLAFSGGSRVGYLLAFGCAGITAICGSVLCGTGLVNAWFDRNKSLPMALTLAAGAIGGFAFPLIAQALCSISVRTCWLCYAGSQIVSILIGIFLVKDRPEDIGEVRDGRAWVEAHADKSTAAVEDETREPTLAACFRSPQLYILAFQLFLSKCVPGAVISYSILFAVQRGVPENLAVWILTIYSSFGLLGRLASGMLDRLHLPLNICYAGSFGMVSAGFLIMSAANSTALFFAGAAVCGTGFGFIYVTQYLLMAVYFGNRNYTTINGTLSTTSFLGNSAGAMLVLAVEKMTGSYMYGFLTIAAVCCVSAGIAAINKARMIGTES